MRSDWFFRLFVFGVCNIRAVAAVPFIRMSFRIIEMELLATSICLYFLKQATILFLYSVIVLVFMDINKNSLSCYII